ncbi:MAG: phosphoribosylanthranilate isomerase [Gemmatimonadaceae bacterium]|nr:phosphoribosylanthranilate isomerase [Gemmatimonadaceae bacterium]
MTVAVKICGLTRPDDAAQAVASGAAYLGAILAGGPRLLTFDQARHVLGPRRPGVQRAAVFGDQSDAEVLTIADALDLDVIQLHGARTPAAVRQLAEQSGRTVWPVLRVAGPALPPEAEALAAAAGHLVLDALVVGQLGGTGVALDWAGLAADVTALRRALPDGRIILAGGLRPSNVAMAIRLLSPDVVDVSSGVETAPGLKDGALVQQFVAAAHGAAETV